MDVGFFAEKDFHVDHKFIIEILLEKYTKKSFNFLL